MKLAIEKVVYGGSGLAHAGDDAAKGQAIFVPFTLPDEVVRATLLETHNNFSEATLEEIIKPSPNRVTPRCVHFGSCGGCQYQHAAYDAQLELKQQILRETLERAGLQSLPSIEQYGSQPWEYRNRIRLRVATIAE
jgi:23S rRNA (uracil1939-C5)-methyltransferase